MGYGRLELSFAEPFADALASNQIFRAWVLSRTKFAELADSARVLDREMVTRRSARYWWRSHYTESCRCFGCSGQETDMFAIFEARTGLRFALHVEVKHPGDKFNPQGHQAASYPVRAKCWVERPPKAVLPHQDATTVLLYSVSKIDEFSPHLSHFDSAITFEYVAKAFPNLWSGRPLKETI